MGLRRRANFTPEEPAFGTILKPTAGITADEVAALVAEAAECPLLLFVKEDEDLYPNLDYSPIRDRVASGNGGDRAGEGTAARQGTDFRPPHHGKGDGLDKRYENQLGYGSDIILIRSQGK